MILVLLGTQNNSFHRLLEEVEKNIENGNIKEKVIVQKGYTKFESKNMILYNHLPLDEINELIEKSELVNTTSETLLAALIPLASAIEQSASFKAKISLTPSPIYPIVPSSFKAFIIIFFCSGVTLP